MLSDTILIPVAKMTLYKDTLCESLTLTGLLGAQRSSVCFFLPKSCKSRSSQLLSQLAIFLFFGLLPSPKSTLKSSLDNKKTVMVNGVFFSFGCKQFSFKKKHASS